MNAVEARSRDGWRRLDLVPVRVLDTDHIELRGLPSGADVRIGLTTIAAAGDGRVRLNPARDPALSGHVGLVEVAIDGATVGEIELVPDKMSEVAYRTLRTDLQRVWTDLVLDPEGITSAQAGPPPPDELWRRIEEPIRQILERPAEVLRVGTEPRRLERVRKRRELSPAVIRSGHRGRPALVRTLQRTTQTPENDLCAATLRLLHNHARRHEHGEAVAANIDRVLRAPVMMGGRRPVRRITWGMRSDRRYRQVLAVHQLLNRPELEPTEGPGELRLGIPALSRLYEYWVFLQVLVQAAKRYGPPEGAGFEQLAVPTSRGTRRLELPAGTTITFPGGIHVAFEPRITAWGDGWMGIEYVPHPHPERQQLVATPDVAVLRTGEAAALTIIDAKYVGRAFVELDAARTHEKYSRMRMHGRPIVDQVFIAHPHESFSNRWAGYGHLDLCPGGGMPDLPLPDPPPGRDIQPVAASLPATTTAVVDQYWLREHLGARRVDLGALPDAIGLDTGADRFVLCMPRIGALIAFARAVEQLGWEVLWLEHFRREEQLDELVALVRDLARSAQVVLVSGDARLVAPVQHLVTRHVDDLSALPDLAPTISAT